MKMIKVLMIALACVGVANVAIASENNKTEKGILMNSLQDVERFCMENECVTVRPVQGALATLYQVSYLVDDDHPGVCTKNCDNE